MKRKKMAVKQFKFIEGITSDVLFEAYGKTMPELFESAASALFSVMYETEKVQPKQRIEIQSEGADDKERLFNFLTDIIVAIETKNMFFSKVEVRIEADEVHAFLYGEKAKKENLLCLIKGVTYYKFDIKKEDNRYKAVVAVDI